MSLILDKNKKGSGYSISKNCDDAMCKYILKMHDNHELKYLNFPLQEAIQANTLTNLGKFLRMDAKVSLTHDCFI